MSRCSSRVHGRPCSWRPRCVARAILSASHSTPVPALHHRFRLRSVSDTPRPRPVLPEVTERSAFRQGVPTEVPLAPAAALKASGYLGRDGSCNCFVQCEVALFHEPDTAAAHPSRDLGSLLTSQIAADVTFVVGSGTSAESFRAHRCVLAARSPVFAAELAGSLMDESHEVTDMDPDAFCALLHFIYTGTLPSHVDQINPRPANTKQDHEATSMARLLLDAADWYGVERLKMICQEKVCAGIGVGNVAADRVLAERRGYKKLKATCMEFLVAKSGHPRFMSV